MSKSSMRAVRVEQRITSSQLPNQRTRSMAYVLIGGLIAGTLDILYAYTFWAVKSQVPAQRVFQDVAAGLLGEASFQGGWSTAALGLALHFLIAIITAMVYYLVALSAGLSSGDSPYSAARSTACWCTE
jgi:ribose/xylose/arabinose/galactoside ABC-type transport system permease subunit